MAITKDTKKKEENKVGEPNESVSTNESVSDTEAKEKVSGSQFVTKNELDSFGDKLFTKMQDLFKKETDVHHDTIAPGTAIPGHEIGQDRRGIEPVSANDFVDQAELEKFMNEMLEIYVHPSPNKEDNPVIVPNVNGVNQPIPRGKVCRIKRKYVEALARNRHTRYEQKVPDATKPHQYIMSPDVVVKDPFTVRSDPNPKGPEWLQAILNER